MAEDQDRLTTLLHRGHPEEDRYRPPGLMLTADVADPVPTGRAIGHGRRSSRRATWLYMAIAACLAMAAVFAGTWLIPRSESTIGAH